MSIAKCKTTEKKIRVIFMGTPEFAIPGLSRLVNEPKFEVVGIYTQTDKATGRKLKIPKPPVKVLAENYDIPVYQPEKIKTEVETIKNLRPDLIVVIAYGKIIPPHILAIPTYGCINVHGSLLPKYRGASCLNAPILNGDLETGITIMQMEAGLDTGPILRQAKIQLTGQEKLNEVHDKLSMLGASILIDTLLEYISGKIKPQIQNDSQASYIKMLKKEDGKIDWQKSALEIERMIRAYNPWPGTFTKNTNGKVIKIIDVDNNLLKTNNQKIGELFIDNNRLAVKCGQDALVILKLQIEGGKIISGQDFINGNSNLIGTCFI